MQPSARLFRVFTLCLLLAGAACPGGGGGAPGADGGGGGGAGDNPDGGPAPDASVPVQTGSVRGRVVNEIEPVGEEDSASGSAVQVYVEEHPAVSAAADADGRFLLQEVPVGAVHVVAEHRVEDRVYRMRTEPIAVAASEVAEVAAPVSVRLADRALAGRVVDSQSAQVLGAVAVTVWGRTTLSAADGSFVVGELVDAGVAYAVRFEKDGYEPLTRSVAVTQADARLLEVSLVRRPDTGAVRGRVVMGDDGLVGVAVLCEQHPQRRTETDSEGRFLLEGVPAGAVRILAVAPFGESVLRGSASVTVQVGTTVELPQPIALSIHSRAVHGFIDVAGGTDADAAGVKVTTLGQSVLSNEFGYFKIEQLPAERLTLAFEKTGLVARTVEVDLTVQATVDLTPFTMQKVPPEEIPDVQVPLRELSAIVPGMGLWSPTDGVVRVSVQTIVRLPENAGVRRRDLWSLTSEDSMQVEPDGFLATNSTGPASTPALVIVGFKDHPALEQVHPLLLKVFHPDDAAFVPADQYIDAASTAEALVLLDNVFWTRPAAVFLQVRQAVRAHASLPALTRSVELALQSPDEETLFGDAITRGAQAIGAQVAAALDLVPPARELPEKKLGEPGEKSVYVEDDSQRASSTVLLTNRTYNHYAVQIYRGSLQIQTPTGKPSWGLKRSTLTSYGWSWPPDRKEQVTADIGPGEFTFHFNKQKTLSLFDGFMTFAGTVIGTGASTYEELSDGMTLLATTGGALLEMINTAASTPINSPSDALALADSLLFTGARAGFDVLMDFAPKYFGAKFAREIKDSWFKTTAKFLYKKALVWGVAAYNTTEIALILYDASQAPDYYEEKAWQTQAGWYGDLFAEKIGRMRTLRVLFSLPVVGTAYYTDGPPVETSVDLEYLGPEVTTGFTFSPDPDNRMLVGASYTLREDALNSVSVEFSNVGFTGFVDRFNSNAFDETKMQFLWGNPGPALVQITEYVHQRLTPPVDNWANLSHWQYSSTDWARVQPGYWYYAGIILSE